MKRSIRTMLITGGIALTLAACGANGQTGAQPGNAAPVAAANTVAGNNQAQNNAGNQLQGRGVMGKVVSVNGTTLTLQDQRQNSTVTIDLTGNTQIFKQTSVALANVPVGQTISANGTLDGDIFTATRARIGATGMGGPGGPNRQPGGANTNAPQSGAGGPGALPNGGAQPNGTAQAAQPRGSRLVGTIEQVSGDTIMVKKADGSTAQLKLAANGEITQQVAGTSADITANAQIIAMGQRSDTTVTATEITIVPTMAQPQ